MLPFSLPLRKRGIEGDLLVIPYRKNLKKISRTLRATMTDSEHVLWTKLRRKQLRGIQFYRQKPIGEAIVDFYAASARLVIEIDGSQHMIPENVQRDKQRDAALESQGLRVLRFNNLQVLQELDAVVETIFQALGNKNPPTPPFGKGGTRRKKCLE
jgi:very-short-patch-repair endonuclease